MPEKQITRRDFEIVHDVKTTDTQRFVVKKFKGGRENSTNPIPSSLIDDVSSVSNPCP